MNATDEQIIDHRDRCPNNNRRNNLRVVTHQQNMWNSQSDKRTIYPVDGIYERHGKLHSYIMKKGIKKRLGKFDNVYDAVLSRIRAEYELYGEYSKNYRNILKTVPKVYLDIWLPEIYSNDNLSFIGSNIWKAHYKSKVNKKSIHWVTKTISARKTGTLM